MARKEIWRDWKPVRFLPFIETRVVALCLETAPGVPVDVGSVWAEWRFRRRGRQALASAGGEDGR